jgi:two-component system NarL family sensor kinase
LKEVAEALNSATTEQRATGEALSRMVDLLGVETGWVWLRESDSGHFYNAAVQNLPPYLQEPVRMTGRSCWCLELFRKGQLTARNIDVVECSRLAPAVASPEAASTAGLRCHASVPLYAGERPLGVMNLAMRGWRRLTRQELDLLTTIADQVGVAVERARLAEQSVEHARHDERSRIARDVHDTLAQDFTAIGLHLEAGLSQLGPRHDARPALTMALDAARQGLEEARRSIASIRTSPLENRSLAEGLTALARQFTAETGVRVPGGHRRRRSGAGRDGIGAVSHRRRGAHERAQAREGTRGVASAWRSCDAVCSSRSPTRAQGFAHGARVFGGSVCPVSKAARAASAGTRPSAARPGAGRP